MYPFDITLQQAADTAGPAPTDEPQRSQTADPSFAQSAALYGMRQKSIGLLSAWNQGGDPAAKEYAEAVAFDKSVAQCKEICGGIGAGAEWLLQDPRLGRKIDVVSHHAINVGVKIAAIAGYGTLTAEAAETAGATSLLGPAGLAVSAVTAILMAGSAISAVLSSPGIML